LKVGEQIQIDSWWEQKTRALSVAMIANHSHPPQSAASSICICAVPLFASEPASFFFVNPFQQLTDSPGLTFTALYRDHDHDPQITVVGSKHLGSHLELDATGREDMWLDRLSGHSTPAATPSGSPPPPANRAYSPAPRRSSHLGPAAAAQRPGFNPRSSSLSLNSNDSTTSLLASSRRPNGSGLKQSVTAVDAPNPLRVLEKLLGPEGNLRSEVSSRGEGSNGNVDLGQDFANELDFEGLSLRELALRASPFANDEHLYTTQTVEECMFYLLQPIL